MSKPHYIFTKEGAAEALNYKRVSQVEAPAKKAIKLGIEVYKVMGGIKYFDIDMLRYPENYVLKEEEFFDIEKKNSVYIQLTLF